MTSKVGLYVRSQVVTRAQASKVSVRWMPTMLGLGFQLHLGGLSSSQFQHLDLWTRRPVRLAILRFSRARFELSA